MSSVRLVVTFVASLICVGLLAGSAHAHEFRPATLSVVERTDGQFDGTLVSPKMTTAGPPTLSVVWPDHCVATAATVGLRQTTTVDCGDRGLSGDIGVAGLEHFPVEVVASVVWLDGRTVASVLRAHTSSLHLSQSDSALSAARTFFAVGARHMIGGLDHLMFIAGLMLLVGLRTRKLIGAITAFTAAHSITLGLSVLDLWRPPIAPVEAAIALSIVFVAVEIRRGAPSLGHQKPWVVALVFGLLHGFGFSAALRETGLPTEHLPAALLAFNIGLEAAQLAFVLGAVTLSAALRPRLAAGPREWIGHALATVMGSVAAYWTLQQVTQFWSIS